MARPLPTNLPGDWYHVTARGNERGAIYLDAGDREHFRDLAAEMVEPEERLPVGGSQPRSSGSSSSVRTIQLWLGSWQGQRRIGRIQRCDPRLLS